MSVDGIQAHVNRLKELKTMTQRVDLCEEKSVR